MVVFIAVFFYYFDTPMVFVNSHFAAHQDKVETRNADYREIMEGVQFERAALDIMSEAHRAFWMGDLNYRIDLPR